MTETKARTSNEVILSSLAPFSHVEVREKQDGTWTVWYPDVSWIPCAPVCRLTDVERSHKHDYEQKWYETHYKPETLADAIDWATQIAEGVEVKVLPYLTAAEKKAATA
jgi:hypothetical protein